jgi:hypothetical protein
VHLQERIQEFLGSLRGCNDAHFVPALRNDVVDPRHPLEICRPGKEASTPATTGVSRLTEGKDGTKADIQDAPRKGLNDKLEWG